MTSVDSALPPNDTRPAPLRALLLSQARMVSHRFGQARRHHRLRLVARVALVTPALLLLFGMVFLVAAVIFTSSATPREASDIFAAIGAFIAFGAFIGTAGAALQILYLSTDLPFLLSLPIPLRAVYTIKLTQSLMGSVPAAIMGVAALAGYSWAWQSGPLAWLVGIIALLLLLIMVASLAVMLVAGVARFIPARRAGLFLGLVSFAIVVLLWGGWAAIAPHPAVGGSASAIARLRLAMAAAGSGIAWTPPAWTAALIIQGAEGNTAGMVRAGALAIAGTVGLSVGGYALFAATFVRGYRAFRDGTVTSQRPDRPLAHWVTWALRPLPRPLAALIVKEWLTMFRDLRRLSGAVWPLGMVVIYTVLLSRTRDAAPAGAPSLGFWLAVGTLALVPWGASLGISIYALGTERRCINLLRSLPVPPRTILAAKIVANLTPVVLASEGASVVVATAHGASAGQLLGLLAIVAWAATGYVTVDTAAAVIGPNFAAEQVQRTTTLTGRLISFAFGAAFTLGSAAAITRLILLSTGPTAGLARPLAWHLGGVAPLGWPLILLGLAIAAGSVALAVAIAESRLTDLIAREPD